MPRKKLIPSVRQEQIRSPKQPREKRLEEHRKPTPNRRRTACLILLAILVVAVTNSNCLALSRAILVPRGAPTGPLAPGVMIDSRWSLLCESVPHAVVMWSCTPFSNETERRLQMDAQIALVTEGSSGAIGCQVFRGSDRTHFANGTQKASVAAQVAGTGVTNFHVVVSMIGHEEDLGEGGYSTNLVGTVTAN